MSDTGASPATKSLLRNPVNKLRKVLSLSKKASSLRQNDSEVAANFMPMHQYTSQYSNEDGETLPKLPNRTPEKQPSKSNGRINGEAYPVTPLERDSAGEQSPGSASTDVSTKGKPLRKARSWKREVSSGRAQDVAPMLSRKCLDAALDAVDRLADAKKVLPDSPMKAEPTKESFQSWLQNETELAALATELTDRAVRKGVELATMAIIPVASKAAEELGLEAKDGEPEAEERGLAAEQAELTHPDEDTGATVATELSAPADEAAITQKSLFSLQPSEEDPVWRPSTAYQRPPSVSAAQMAMVAAAACTLIVLVRSRRR